MQSFFSQDSKQKVGTFDINTGIYSCENPLKKGAFIVNEDSKFINKEHEGFTKVIIRKPKMSDIIEYTKHLDTKIKCKMTDGNLVYSNEYIEYDVYKNDDYFFEKLR